MKRLSTLNIQTTTQSTSKRTRFLQPWTIERRTTPNKQLSLKRQNSLEEQLVSPSASRAGGLYVSGHHT